MMALTRSIMTLMVVISATSVTNAQYLTTFTENDRGCASGRCRLDTDSTTGTSNYRPTYSTSDNTYRSDTNRYDDFARPAAVSSPIGYSDIARNFSDSYRHEWDRYQSGYDYRAPLNSAVEDSFRTPVSNSSYDRGRELHNRYDSRRTLPDPFQIPSMNNRDGFPRYQQAPLRRDFRTEQDYRDRNSQTRYRIPMDQVDYSPLDDNRRSLPQFDDRSQNRYDNRYENGISDRVPSNGYQNRPQRPGVDPFTPPLPRRDSDNEVDSINKAITARYGNPVNVRAVQAMSANQALALYREVSQQTDGRHLEPSSYDLRVRRAIRNLGLALENPTFTQSLGVQADSFRVDGFRTTLSRISTSMQVSNINDAQEVVQRVMREAQSVPGLTASIVGFEFANATVDTLDKFSALEPKEPGRGASLELDGVDNSQTVGLETEIVGIGVEVKIHAEGLLIVKPLRGGPAADAGLQSGDVITAIDGRSIRGMALANSVDLMKGTSGSRMQLQLVRNGSRPTNMTLVRRRVQLFTVNDARLLPGSAKVAYLSLSQFGQKSTEELDQALNQLHNDGMKSLILDLRGNPGGLLNVCVDITNRFLPCGTIVSTKGRLSSDNMVETASFSRTWSTPLVVLVDGDSASASEIFAAAVQDNQRGIVVGERSYGKGTVQTHFPLSSVNGNLRLTTARFYSPNGRPMSGEGVTPDVRITDADGVANGDRVLEEALVIAQSQRLKDIAQAARSCKPSQGQPLQRNSFHNNMYDPTAPKTVVR